MNNLNRYRYEIESRRILELQAMIENKTGLMFHEFSPDLDETCVKALDGEIHASFVINTLCKIVDDLNSRGVK